MDALCKRFNIDNSKRIKHNALVDCKLLQEVYINLVDQKEPKLHLENVQILDKKYGENLTRKASGKVIKANSKEIQEHKEYLSNYLNKNYF